MRLNQPILDRAEKRAADGGSLEDALIELRRMPLDDFGLLMQSMPDERFPALSRLLPPMADVATQKSWTGAAGVDLLRQSVAFIRQLETLSFRHAGRGLDGATILDFGCGYGRLTRLLYYFTDPAGICGVDAWDRAIRLCRAARLPGRFLCSDARPERLATSTIFDVAFAFSVFTHLPPRAAGPCLTAVRRNIRPGGIFVVTIRPVEYWEFYDERRGGAVARDMAARQAREGYAFLAHEGRGGELYGEASYDLSFFRREGWSVAGYDRTLANPHEIAVVLKAC